MGRGDAGGRGVTLMVKSRGFLAQTAKKTSIHYSLIIIRIYTSDFPGKAFRRRVTVAPFLFISRRNQPETTRLARINEAAMFWQSFNEGIQETIWRGNPWLDVTELDAGLVLRGKANYVIQLCNVFSQKTSSGRNEEKRQRHTKCWRRKLVLNIMWSYSCKQTHTDINIMN